MNEDDVWGCWEVREPNSTFDPTQRYVNDRTDYFTLEFHHGGQFSDFPEVNYEGGKVSYIDKVNVDVFSVIIVNDMLASLGYSEDDVPNQCYVSDGMSCVGKAKSDLLLNNHCEVFNKQLVQGQDKPIITCLEFIREYLMKRLVIVHKIIAKCNGPLTPNAAKTFDDIKKDAGSCNVIWCGPSKYQVSGPHIIEQRVVNIDQRSCSCRRWDLTGMPCRHAVACIWNMRLNGIGDGIPEKFVDRAYWLDTWKAIYAHTIEPINGMDMWPKSQCPTTLINPKFHKQSGRPKKKRKKSAAEIEDLKNKVQSDPKLPRKDNSLTCGLCKGKGHNRRTCKSGGGNVKQSGAGSSTGPSVAGSSTGTSGV